MELTWKQLMQVMGKIADQAYQLIETAQKLKEAINQEKVELIGRIVIEQEHQMKTFTALEQERLALVESIGKHFHLSKEGLNAAALQAYIPPAWSNDYRMQVKKLKQSMDSLKQVNKVNQKLLQQSRQFMSWLINYLVTPTGSTAMYNGSGISVQNSSYHVVNQNM